MTLIERIRKERHFTDQHYDLNHTRAQFIFRNPKATYVALHIFFNNITGEFEHFTIWDERSGDKVNVSESEGEVTEILNTVFNKKPW